MVYAVERQGVVERVVARLPSREDAVPVQQLQQHLVPVVDGVVQFELRRVLWRQPLRKVKGLRP